LTPASGRQDHTNLPYAATSLVRSLGDHSQASSTRPAIPSRARRCRVHRIPHPTSVTIAKRPSWWDGMAGVVDVIWGVRKQKYFCKRDSTGKSKRRPTGKSVGVAITWRSDETSRGAGKLEGLSLVPRTRRSVRHAAPHSRDPCRIKRTVQLVIVLQDGGSRSALQTCEWSTLRVSSSRTP
jgi:hypothetical protein